MARRPIRHVRRPRAIALLGAVGLALVAGAYFFSRGYEVVDEGRFFSYTPGKTIYEIRVFDLVTVYAENDVRPTLDVFNSYLLTTVSSIGLFALLLLWRLGARRDRRLEAFLALLWLGAGFLAADELLSIHESIGHNLRFLAGFAGSRQPDGAVLIAYGIVGLAYLVAFRDLLLASRTATRLFIAGVVLTVLAFAGDGRAFLGHGGEEEVVEALASISFGAGFALLCADHVRAKLAAGGSDAVQPPEPAPEGSAELVVTRG